MATGIRDKVAILGMGCSKFGERWDKEADDLMVEAFEEALKDAGIEKNQIESHLAYIPASYHTSFVKRVRTAS